MSADNIVLGLSIIGVLGSIAGGLYLGYSYGHIEFLSTAHYVSLVFLIIAGILTWAAMVWMVHPSEFRVNTKQWISFFFTIIIAILWWARYAFTVSEAVESEESGTSLKDKENLTDDL